jgi:hypothetical protein
MKTCSSCEIEKELDEFPKGKKYTDGRRVQSCLGAQIKLFNIINE